MNISRTLVLVSLVISTPMVVAQAPAPPVSATSAESGQLAQGFAWLAQGDTDRAAELATRLLAEYPGSAAVASFAVDVDLARGGPMAALDTYERWLGNKRLESGYVLRQIARAVLRTAARDQASSAMRLEALRALAADDDPEARAELDRAVAAGGSVEAGILATKGDDHAVKLLIAELNSIPGSKARQIDALGASGNPLAIKPLIALLDDGMDINRSSAAEALGRLGAKEAIVKLKLLLNDPFFPVKVKAAGALYRLNDMSGLSFLRQLESSEHAGYRLAAAEAMSSTPDAAWQNLVRGLTQDPDPKIRAAAARLMAPHDPELAKTTLERLLTDDNIAIRELAAASYSETVANDFAALRRVLRTGDTSGRIRAAARILELTR